MPGTYTDHRQPNQIREGALRASDHDRDAVAAILREQHLEGRLKTEEFEERLDRCYAARTYGELDELVADLPRQQPSRSVGRAWRWPALALMPVLIAAIALSHGHVLWLAIPLLFLFGRPLLWRSAGHGRGWRVGSCAAGLTRPGSSQA